MVPEGEDAAAAVVVVVEDAAVAAVSRLRHGRAEAALEWAAVVLALVARAASVVQVQEAGVQALVQAALAERELAGVVPELAQAVWVALAGLELVREELEVLGALNGRELVREELVALADRELALAELVASADRGRASVALAGRELVDRELDLAELEESESVLARELGGARHSSAQVPSGLAGSPSVQTVATSGILIRAWRPDGLGPRSGPSPGRRSRDLADMLSSPCTTTTGRPRSITTIPFT